MEHQSTPIEVEQAEQPKMSLSRSFSLRRLGSLKQRRPKEPEPETPVYENRYHDNASSDSSPRPKKNWAESYINGPLTAPDPSQETGPGSSFHRTLNHSDKVKQVVSDSYPTPPTSASPRNSFQRTNPFSVNSSPNSPQSPTPNHLLRNYSESDTKASRRASASSTVKSHRSATSTGLGLDFIDLKAEIQLSGSIRSATSRSTGLGRSNTIRTSNRYPPTTVHPPNLGIHRSQTVTSQDSGLQRSQSTNSTGPGLRRNGSLSQRYPGDMSHRPLEQIKRETRAADRAPHLRKKHLPATDTIDYLDNVGIATYHHEGPYDATLASRNKNKKYAPVEAVKYGNMKAIEATPREHIIDSLHKHVPLQGTATIPPGETDINGRRMSYEEGADLMREPDAPGGSYKRYDHIPYSPDDLKGKGEPSFTIERDLKEQKRQRVSRNNENEVVYEMQPRSSIHKNDNIMVRQRSYSSSANDAGPSNSISPVAMANNSDVHQSNTTGKRLSDGLKRRFGSLRRKPLGT